jgi:hypothetical protein
LDGRIGDVFLQIRNGSSPQSLQTVASATDSRLAERGVFRGFESLLAEDVSHLAEVLQNNPALAQ